MFTDRATTLLRSRSRSAARRVRSAAAHALQQQRGVRLRLDDLATGVAQVKSRFGRANLQKPKSVVNTY